MSAPDELEKAQKELAETKAGYAKLFANALRPANDRIKELEGRIYHYVEVVRDLEAQLADCERHENCYGPEPVRKLDAELAVWKGIAKNHCGATTPKELDDQMTLWAREWEKSVALTEKLIDQKPSCGFEMLRMANEERFATSKLGKACADWTLGDWGNAMAGEAGEACNKIKKLRRGEPIDPKDIADELADTVVYGDLICQRLGVNLWEAVVRKFNEVSGRVGSHVRLPAGGVK